MQLVIGNNTLSLLAIGDMATETLRLRAMISALERDVAPGLVVLEVYSGMGSHGHFISDVLAAELLVPDKYGKLFHVPTMSLSIDNDPPVHGIQPTFKCNVFGFDEANLRLLRSKFPKK